MENSAVEWLIDEWLHLDADFDMVLIDRKTYWDKLKEIQRQAKEMEEEQRGYSEEDVRLAYFQGEKDSYVKGGQTKEMENEFIESLQQKKLNKSEKGCACYGSNSIHKCNCN